MRLATSILIVAVLALAGCGDSSDETTTAPAEGGASKESVRAAWERSESCRRPPGASRWGCSVGSYRCQGVVTGRGLSVSCAKPGRSISFIVPRG